MRLDEHQLEQALARKHAPDGFADRVMTRLGESQPQPRSQQRWQWPSASTVRRIAAALILAAALGGLTAHQVAEHRRAEGELARREVMTALHIASAKMRVAQRAVVRDE
jgi:hypothetical protein